MKIRLFGYAKIIAIKVQCGYLTFNNREKLNRILLLDLQIVFFLRKIENVALDLNKDSLK